MKICASIAPASMAEAIRKLSSAGKKADLVEVRIDGMADVDFERLLRKPRPGVIITNRRSGEGGAFSGSADEQIDILSRAIGCGADFVDVEMSWGLERILFLSRNSRRTKIIVSYHNFDETPDDLETVYANMRKTGAEILKIATTANDIIDNKRVFALLKRAKRDRQKLIAFCMGERGQASRILSARFGGFLTYASPEVDESTAPGQFTVDDLKHIYRIAAFNSRTEVFGLVGNPVSQSKGIFYHNTIFKRKDVNAIYLNFLVDDLASFLDTFSGELHGFSVTMPFKERIIPFLETIDAAAGKLQAVNTVIVSKRRLIGFNTDLSAIVQIMKKKIQPRGKHIVVLGTGGTARALAFASVSLGAHTTVVGRSSDKARALASEFGCEWALFDFLEEFEDGRLDERNFRRDASGDRPPAGFKKILSKRDDRFRRRLPAGDDAVARCGLVGALQGHRRGGAVHSAGSIAIQTLSRGTCMTGEPARCIRPAKRLDAEVHIPPSKSYTNRALIVAALAEGVSQLVRPSLSDDSRVLIDSLRKFGVGIRERGEILEVDGTAGHFLAPATEIFVGNAGTAMRFLSSFAALAKGTSVINGDDQMLRRPIGDLLSALQSAGVKATGTNGFPPVTIVGGNFLGGRIGISASISSQFASSLLLSAPYARRPVTLHITDDISSLPYIDMSLHVMRSFGAHVKVIDQRNFDVDNSQKYIGREFHIEADATSASYFLAAAALTGGRVRIPDLSPDSLQGDLKFLSVLEDMGCAVARRSTGVELRGGRLFGTEVDMNSMPDCVPTLAVLAAFAEGPTRIGNVAHLKYKETDRLSALAAQLRRMGTGVEQLEDGLIIQPQPPHGAEIETYDDHRMAMSFAVAGLKVEGIVITNPACVSKSFPGFWEEFGKIEGKE